LTRSLPLMAGVCSLLLCSCDKAEKLAKEAKARVSEKVGEVSHKVEDATHRLPESKGEETKGELDALVDQTPDGYQFRRDLPFVSRIDVSVETEVRMKGRFYKSSLLGKELTSVDGTLRYTENISLDGDSATIESLKAPFEPNDPVMQAKIKEEGIKYDRTSAEFVRKNGKWDIPKPGDLMAAAAAADWKAGFSGLLAREGLTGRKQWFGKGRLKIGDGITLADDDLALFEIRPAKGKLVLKLEAVESLNGHPCGMFSIRGTYECNGAGSSWAGAGHERISIESGKVWLSLLYPLVLKEDYDAVMSASGGKQGDPMVRTQGSVHVLIKRDWKPHKAQ